MGGGGGMFSKIVSHKIGSSGRSFSNLSYFRLLELRLSRKNRREKIVQGILSPNSLCKLTVQRALDSKRPTQDSLCKSPRQDLRKVCGSSD